MEESRRKESSKKTEEGIKERKSEATSKDTLSDLEDIEKISDSRHQQQSERASVPSPDGQPDNRSHDGS